MSNPITISEEEFEAWKQHPVTKGFFRWLDVKHQNNQNSWSAGQYQDADVYKSAVRNAGALGQCSMIAEIKMLEHAQLEEDLSDE